MFALRWSRDYTKDSKRDSPNNHKNNLHEISPDDSSEPSSNSEETSNGQEYQDREVDRTVSFKTCRLGDEQSTSI